MAFLVSLQGYAEISDGRHNGSGFASEGGGTHDTSSARELDLLHQGTCCARRRLAVRSWRGGRAVT